MVYCRLLNYFDSKACPLPPNENSIEDVAEHAISSARMLGCEVFVQSRDLISGNPRLSMAFLAQLFNFHPDLHVPVPATSSDDTSATSLVHTVSDMSALFQ
jgi:hypothetical protein